MKRGTTPFVKREKTPPTPPNVGSPEPVPTPTTADYRQEEVLLNVSFDVGDSRKILVYERQESKALKQKCYGTMASLDNRRDEFQGSNIVVDIRHNGVWRRCLRNPFLFETSTSREIEQPAEQQVAAAA